MNLRIDSDIIYRDQRVNMRLILTTTHIYAIMACLMKNCLIAEYRLCDIYTPVAFKLVFEMKLYLYLEVISL